jgi:peroxiredoxin Q/BCP
MVELRKRKTPPPAPVRPAKKEKKAPKSKVEQVKEVIKEKVEAVTGKSNGEPAVVPATGAIAPKVGDTIALTSFGGEVETHEGTKTTLAKLVEESKSGVVLFTYPKASTPGCKCAP